MHIAGWTKTSLIDFPGRASTVVFIGGCNFRCAYCHNPEIIFAQEQAVTTTEKLLAFLQKRRRFLDGICISGGEPTLDEGLCAAAERIKGAGYEIKLDTNGTRPDILKKLIEGGLADYIAMDIKAPFERYNEIAGTCTDIGAVAESIQLLLAGRVGYEFRTTVCQEQLMEEDVRLIGEHIKGAQRYYLQNYRKAGVREDWAACFSPHSPEQMERFKQIAQKLVKEVGIR